MHPDHYAIIMAGGVGSRFWPISRTGHPKQFHDLLGTGKSLIRLAYDRLAGLMPAENLYIVTNQLYLEQVQEHVPELPLGQILLEPVGRNTAPCIAYAAHKILKRNPRAKIVVAASDHLIQDVERFQGDLKQALDIVTREPVIVTLGITPTRPDTGYGYIQFWDNEEQPETRYHKVKTFTEKPSEEIAKTFIESGEFLWNSGMFIFSAQTILEALARYSPDLNELFMELSPVLDTPEEPAKLADVYTRCRNISIDFAVMEKADNVFVIQSDFGWSDLGTWRSLYDQLHKDGNGNVLKGNIVTYDASGNLILSPTGKLIVVKGIQNKIVVVMDDVTLILDREDEQSVRDIVANIRLAGGIKYL